MKKTVKKLGKAIAITFDEKEQNLFNLKEGDVLIIEIVGKENNNEADKSG